jgi:hypothetical protein
MNKFEEVSTMLEKKRSQPIYCMYNGDRAIIEYAHNVVLEIAPIGFNSVW